MTKAALAREMQRILALPAGTVLTGADHAFAEEIASMHPTATEKTGPGIAQFVIRPNGYGHGNELHIVRVDGSEVDISYRRALAPVTPATKRADIFAALRQEIAGQIVAFKRQRLERGRAMCAVSDVTLDEKTAHVDHVPPWTFMALAEAWLADRPTPELTEIGNRGRRLADRRLAAEWQQFHKWSARLRLIHSDINSVIATTRGRVAAR